MFGSGAKTIGMIAMLERRMMARRGLIMIIVLSPENVCAAVLGSTSLFSVVLPTAAGSTPTTAAAGSTPTTATASAVFGLRVSPQDFNPLLFCLFALFYFFLFFSLSRR